MKRTKMIQKSLLALTLTTGLQSVASAEYRCGWLNNPSPDQYQFIDRDASWAIMQRGGYRLPAQFMKNLPDRQPNEFVRTNGSYGYSCSCMSVTTDARTKRITSIVYKGKQVLLKRCLEDKVIAKRNNAALRSVTPRNLANQRSTARNLAATSGSYTDTPVIAGEAAAEPTQGYYDVPQLAANSPVSTAAATRQPAKAVGRSKSHYIQVIVTSIPAKAKRLKRTFDKAGFKTIIKGVKVKGKLLHKVRVGPYPNRRAALNSQNKLRQSFRKNQGVQKSIITG
ncbi:MAG: DUF4087 domain-containing protein [Leucothrix sp.]